MKKFLSLLLSVMLSLTLFVGCKTDNSGDDNNDGGSNNNPEFSIVKLDAGVVSNVTDLSLYIDSTRKLFAVPNGATDTMTQFGGALTWSISDDTVASLSVGKNTSIATLEGLKAGTTKITVTDSASNYREFTVNVKDASISAPSNDIIMFVDKGESTLNVSSMFSIADNLPITYTSSNTQVVSVNGSVLTAKTAGKVVLTAKCATANTATSVNVIVYDDPIVLESESFILEYNNTVKESVDLNVISKHGTLNYATSNPNVFVVENGKIVAKGVGTATLTITGGEDTAVATIEVVEVKSNTVTVNSLTNSKVNLFGRNVTANGGVRFEYTVSGYEFKFYGTAAYAEMSAIVSGGYHPRFQVLVDGEKVDQTEADDNAANTEKSVTAGGQKILNINATTKQTYTLVEGLTEGWHTVKVLKRTPAKRGSTIMDKAVLYTVSTNEGGFIGSAPKKPELKIDVYGDSISCAYGNLCGGGVMEDNTTNGLLAFHYLAAEQLGAEINVQAHSGWGLVCDNAKATNWLWPKYFTKLSDGSTSYDMGYDADVIVINLGTNDNNSDLGTEAFTALLKNGAISWAKQLLSYNPNAKIVFSYGMMGASNRVVAGYEQAVTALKGEGYNNVYFLKYTNQTNGGGHPSKADHITNGKVLANFISSIL